MITGIFSEGHYATTVFTSYMASFYSVNMLFYSTEATHQRKVLDDNYSDAAWIIHDYM